MIRSQVSELKIAYVYDAVYPWVKGGAEKRIYRRRGAGAEKTPAFKAGDESCPAVITRSFVGWLDL